MPSKSPHQSWKLSPRHPTIVDAAVIGIKQHGVHEGSELPRAYVVRRPDPEGDELTEQDVYDTIKAKLTKYKWLEGGVKFVDAIRRTRAGREGVEEMEAKLSHPPPQMLCFSAADHYKG